jgi:hypothetical protein
MSGYPDNGQSLVTSYLNLRRFIGVLGLAFPLVLLAGGQIVFHTGLRPSLSDYYHTGMRDVFVGTLWAIGVFLVSYRGYQKRDDVAGNLACVFAVGLSIFPVAGDAATGTEKVIGHLHFIFAAAFFLTLVYFSLFLFTKTDPNANPTHRKVVRNRWYRVCGWVMLVCVAGIAIFKLLLADAWVSDHKVVFILEAIAIEAFGFSWFVKGEAILGDRPRTGGGEMIATGVSGS